MPGPVLYIALVFIRHVVGSTLSLPCAGVAVMVATALLQNPAPEAAASRLAIFQ